ncbi:hydrogenase nickel incorporation protein HypB [Prauserella shujinwangii]|uniref:Hydrogenase nickel incorporation protein HypB n=1 Tax=Prauserella shujinwangii TaxID=1453103 RepID=A0A2T0M2P4_9PSEU|nr:hydrogenase nickel incorporation protein HypB [Prauserella shujinwangii]PRX51007.1 hydrogenase nickel incorporation protein HypB [Prauserella shujinwangii]
MCATCGCDGGAGTIDEPGHELGKDGHEHSHEHSHDHSHEHNHDHSHEHETVVLEQDVLAKNDRAARRNREWLRARGVCAVNLMSSPGSGKTTLLERAVGELSRARPVMVVEGDQATPMDAERLRATGCRTVQINTGSGCHLDAEMIERALRTLDPGSGTLVFVENVGNLVCPALFDLGEARRVVLASTTEGEDKPLKYPHMFRGADLVLLTKVDLLPHLRFDVERFHRHLGRVNPDAELLPVSAVAGEGLDDWYGWLTSAVPVPAR